MTGGKLGVLQAAATGLLVFGVGCGGPEPRGGLAVWAVGDCQLAPLEYDALLESNVYDRLAGRITLSAAINEVVSFQLVLEAPAGGDQGARVEITPPASPQGRISPEHVAVYRPIPVTVDRTPGWLLRRWPRPAGRRRYYDALAPLKGAVRVAAGETLPLWVDLEVPYGTAPGLYECQVIVTEGSGRETRLPLSLEVWPFALPPEAKPVVLAPLSSGPLLERLSGWRAGRRTARVSAYEPRCRREVELIHAAAGLLHEHGLSVYVDDCEPVMKVDPSGRVRVEWSDYDLVHGPLLDGSAYKDRRPARYWPLPVWPDFPDPDRFEGSDSSIFGRVFSGYVSACRTHVNALGKAGPGSEDRGPAILAVAESAEPGPASYGRYARLARLARQAAPDLPLVTTFCPQDMSELGWHGFVPMPTPQLVDIWSPPGRYFEPVRSPGPAGPGRRMWLRPDEPSYTGSLMVEAPPLDARCLPWQAYVQGASVIWLYPVNRWPPSGSLRRLEFIPETRADWLIYPGELAGLHRQALPSVRLKRLRRGLQDVRYLALLRRHGRPEIAQLICETLFRAGGTEAYGDHFADARPFGWVEDPALWELARGLMAAQVVRALAGQGAWEEPDRSRVLELEWRRLQQGARRIRLFVEGTALGYEREGDSVELRAQAHLRLVNETRRPLMGRLRFGEERAAWPLGSGGLSDREGPACASRIESLEAESHLHRRISLQLDNLPTSADGHFVIPVEFDAGANGAVRAEARLAYVLPLVLREPIELDGDLSDWPVGVGNSAGEYRLVGSRPRQPGQTSVSDVPIQGTRSYVAADHDYLYFAFDCREECMEELRVGMNNFVRYDGLTPVGEDFVEVVIDPTNARTRSTGDLYHLLVKANGVVLSHRGIGCEPPTGPHDLWFSGAEAQVRHGAEGWTAELRVPREAFPPQARHGPIWAINFARFQARLAEYSNWAGAKRHVYSPLSMGNLVWPEQLRAP